MNYSHPKFGNLSDKLRKLLFNKGQKITIFTSKLINTDFTYKDQKNE